MKHLKLGLVGTSLKHSKSPKIQEFLLNEFKIKGEYKLYETNDLQSFVTFAKSNLDGFNITFPYKQEIMQYCDEISLQAKQIGAVNTVVIKNNKIIGSNVDYFGVKYYFTNIFNKELIKKALVFGYGGASLSVIQVLKDLKIDFFIANRTLSKVKHENKLSLKQANNLVNDFDLIINTTSVGYNNDSIVTNLDYKIKYAFDLNYQPYFTKFVKDAMKRTQISKNGLDMLIIQAIHSFKLFSEIQISNEVIEQLLFKIKLKLIDKVILIDGFMGSGKTSVLNKLNLEYSCDLDVVIQKQQNQSINQIVQQKSMNEFRKIESKYFKESVKNNKIIALGGGTSYYNHEWIVKNKNKLIIIYLDCDKQIIKKRLKNDTSRPLNTKIDEIYDQRVQNYNQLCDFKINSNQEVSKIIQEIIERL